MIQKFIPTICLTYLKIVMLGNICSALKQIAVNHPDTQIIYPVHLNPNVQEPVNRILANKENIYLIEPLGVYRAIFVGFSGHLNK